MGGMALHIDIDIGAIVGRRMAPFCREVSCIVTWGDLQLWADYVNGLLMTGWACPSLALPAKLTPQSSTLQSVAEVNPAHSQKIAPSVKSSGDAELDTAAWEKSKKQFSVQTSLGRFLRMPCAPEHGYFPAARFGSATVARLTGLAGILMIA